MSEGISKTTFVVGLVAAILASSLFSTVVSMQLAKDPKGDKGDTGDPGLQGAQGPAGPPGYLAADYDSGWINITDKTGKYFDLTHNLNSTDVMVDITGRTAIDGGDHKANFGGTIIQKFGHTYGYPYSDEARSVVQTSDGGYAILGRASYGSYDFWLVKTDSKGNMLWNRTYGGADQEFAFSVVQCEDGGYAMAGSTSSFGMDTDFYLVKTDSSGNMEWNKTYGGAGGDAANSVIQTSDGGYVLAGRSQSYSGDFWVVKTDSEGNMLWNSTYGGNSSEEAQSIIQTVDGGYAILGYTYSFGAGGADFWLVKTDADGNSQWNRTYGGVELDSARSVIGTIDGGFALVGVTSSFGAGSSDFWLVKTDASGNIQWNRTYGGKTGDSAESLVQTSNGGYVIAGSTGSYGAGLHDYWVVKTDINGNPEWAKTYGGQWEDYAYSVVVTTDDGFVIAGVTGYTGGAPTGDFWVIKIDAEGDHGWTQSYVESGLMWANSTNNTLTLCRGRTDRYWNYVRVRIWKIKENQ